MSNCSQTTGKHIDSHSPSFTMNNSSRLTNLEGYNMQELQLRLSERIIADHSALDNASALLGLCRASLGGGASVFSRDKVSDGHDTVTASNNIEIISNQVKTPLYAASSDHAKTHCLDEASRKRKLSEDTSNHVPKESLHYDDNDDESYDESQKSASEAASKMFNSSNDENGLQQPKKYDRRRREERNKREKLRSSNIAKQICELRDLLTSGGISVPKGTKGSVLSEAANYIKFLQKRQIMAET
jgi:Helix-loop-helix DNA-binding domain